MRRAKKEAKMRGKLLPYEIYAKWEPLDSSSYNSRRTEHMEFRASWDYHNNFLPIFHSGIGHFIEGLSGDPIHGYYLISESMSTVAVLYNGQIYIVGKVTEVSSKPIRNKEVQIP